MPTPLLIDALRDFLIAEGVVRDPRVAGADPPCWRSPRMGVPAPGDGDAPEMGASVVVGIFPAAGIARDPYEASVLRTDGIDIRIRSLRPPDAINLDDEIRGKIMDKRALSMAGLQIVECRLERPMNLIVSDEQGFDYITGYLFERSA